MKTVEQLAQSTNPALVRAFGAIRRFAVTLTDRAIWQVAGVLMPDGRETLRAEVFGGVGFSARPPSDSDAEAIVAMGGGATNPVIVAVRDEKTRAAVAGDLQPDESAMFNSQAIIVTKADGTIEARSANGTAVELALKSDLDALRAALLTAVIALGANGAAAVVAAMDTALGVSAPWPVGTTKLKGE